MDKKLRVLVVSYLPWRNDVSVGNTLTNLFEGLKDKIEFANIYFKGGKPNNSVASKYFYIPEGQLAKSIVTRKNVGSEIYCENEPEEKLSNSYNKARQLRWESLLLVQDLIGVFGKWKSDRLDKFIKEFEPDIVFGPLGRVPAGNLMMVYLKDKFHVPVVTYAWDDHYSLHKKSKSIFFWIKTLIERKYIRKCADISSYIYTITEPMAREYSEYFHKECKLLYKAYDFGGAADLKESVSDPIKIIYMGNTGLGRWKVLAEIVKALEEINAYEKKAQLYIYTMTPLSEKARNLLDVPGISQLMKPVDDDQVLPTMRSADILLHVEPTDEKERLFFRLSFSTKIVDYLYSARCIFAVGGETAAMQYLKNNDAAIVTVDNKQITGELSRLTDDPNLIIQYGKKAWDCGVRNHQRTTIQGNIYNDFKKLVREESCERIN